MKRMLAGILAAVVVTVQSVVGATVVVPATDDAAILNRVGSPGVAATNFGLFHYLYAGSYDADALSYSRSLLKFLLPSTPVGLTLDSAKLQLVVGQEYPQTKQFDFFRVGDAWDEATVTWNSAPQPLPADTPIAGFDSGIGLGPAPPPRNGLMFDITTVVDDELNIDPTRTLSILWKERDEAGACCNRLAAYSEELAVLPTNVPQIILTYVPEPTAVVYLLMSGTMLGRLRMRRSGRVAAS